MSFLQKRLTLPALLLSSLILSAPCTARSVANQIDFARSLAGRCTQVDPGFPYFQSRSLDGVAEEIKANGYQCVNITVTDGGKYPIADVLVRHGISVRLLGLPMNGGWVGNKYKEWRVVRKDPHFGENDGFSYLCENNPGYRKFKQRQMVDLLLLNPAFVGIDLAEPHIPAWEGPDSPGYGCLCDFCRKKFLSEYPEETEIPNFYDESSPKYWKTDKVLYNKWVDFRVNTVANFFDFVVNGPGGIRERCPKVRVTTWTLGCQIRGGDVLALEREWQAMDAAAVVAKVHPDAHCIQTDWPDWVEAKLPADYVKNYAPYVASIRRVDKSIPITLQTDSGSIPCMHRSFEWLNEMDRAAKSVGFAQTFDYQYHLAEDFYTKSPKLIKAELSKSGKKLTLMYNMYLDPKIAGDASNYGLSAGRVVELKADGNLVHITVENVKVGDKLTVARMGNNPGVLLHPGYKQTVAKPTTITITAIR